MTTLVLTLVLLSGLLPTASPRRSNKGGRLVIRYLYLKNCAASKTSLTVQEFATHLQKDGDQSVDANFTNTRTIQGIHSAEIKITRCREVVSHNTCEYFSTWSWKTGICQLMNMPNMFWSPAADSMEPRITCPFKENLYMMRNATWDLTTLRLAFEGFVWMGTLTARDLSHKTFICLDGGIQVIKARRVDSQQ